MVARLCSVALSKSEVQPKQEQGLELSEALTIRDTHAILIYLSTLGGSLYPEDSQVLVDSWLEVVETHYKVPFTIWTSPYFSSVPVSEELISQSSKDCKALLKELDGSLKKSQFLAGDSLTLADISLASELFHAFRLVVDENTRKGFKSTVDWFLRVSQVAEFEAVWGKIELCKTALPVVRKEEEGKQDVKKEEVKKQQPKKEKKPKENVQIDKEAQARKQQERKEKKEQEALAKLQAEQKKKEEESKAE